MTSRGTRIIAERFNGLTVEKIKGQRYSKHLALIMRSELAISFMVHNV